MYRTSLEEHFATYILYGSMHCNNLQLPQCTAPMESCFQRNHSHLRIGVALQLLVVEREGADQWLGEGGGGVKQLTQLIGEEGETLNVIVHCHTHTHTCHRHMHGATKRIIYRIIHAKKHACTVPQQTLQTSTGSLPTSA